MTSYVDVDRSEEALQEDEELIEAVELIVAKSAEAIITDVKNDVSGFYETIKNWFDRIFPFVEYWRADPALFWRDMQHLAISGVLFVVFFLVLSPWQQNSRRHGESNDKYKNGLRRQPSSYDRLMQFGFGQLNMFKNPAVRKSPQNTLERSKSTSSIIHAALNNSSNSRDIPQASSWRSNQEDYEDDETEWESFNKRWPAILETPYRHLVLPPDCKRVEKPKRAVNNKASLRTSRASPPEREGTSDGVSHSSIKKRTRRSKRTKDSSDDHPWERLVSYFKHLFHLIMLFRRYDYAGAGWTLIHWFQAMIRARTRQGQPETEEDDDEDEYSVASSSMMSTSMDQEDSGGRATSSSTTTRGRPKKEHSGSTTPVTGNRSRLSPRTSRSKKEKMKKAMKEAPEMPNIVVDDKARDSDEMKAQTSPNEAAAVDENSESTNEDPVDSLHVASTPVVVPTFKTYDDDHPADQEDFNFTNKSEEKKEIGSYGEEILTQSPPPSMQIRGGDNLSFHTPMRESHLPMLDIPATPPSTPALTAATQTTLLSCKSSPMNGNKIPTVSSVTKTKDALQSYRKGGTRTWTGQFHPIPAKVTSSDNPSGKASIERQDSGRNASYYFETADSKENLKKMVVEVPVPDRNGYILGDEFLPDNNFTPLLAFVNSRSGPQQGHLLITQLRGLLNPIQVWDLADGGPEEVLESFSAFTRLRILVCGGDGTVSWIVSTIEKMELQRWPPIAILPLGTGNDLARIHGWGGGYNNESLINILEQVSDGYISWLDRWEMTVENKKGRVKQVKSFFNYLGVGADAQAALQVHMLRESRPQLFFSRLVNKAWYGVFGAEDIIKATSINLPNDITLIADGVEVPLPADSQGIILLNIDSYAGGVPLWSSGHKADITSTGGFQPMKRSKSLDALRSLKNDRKNAATSEKTIQTPLTPSPPRNFDRIDSVEDLAALALSDEEKYSRVTACNRPSSCQDGLLDIVSIRGAFHLGQIRVGLSTAQKLCQCREATIIIKRKVSVQIDGEPWRQNVCTLKVRKKKESAIMLHCPGNESNGVETEMAKLLDWAEDRNLINKEVHGALMKEFSRRIESKTRQRRSKEHPLLTLKRAMKSGGNIQNRNSDQNSQMFFGSSSNGIRGQLGSPAGNFF
ncbi:diacylglycerol kinase accessory domain protein [Nitzschia inconspicua]|uniref:Diacylglycerol kinase n=1 Tax=Nitzschia inconspicua TaxID=303405 RepID=A0A9K3LR27_9STRA|nr:diacylglycerol kinase accessory domain protein [Nitzschia inconspicua]